MTIVTEMTQDMEEFQERWRTFREAMPVANNLAYFDHAAVAPLPKPTRDAINDWATQACQEGDTAWLQWERRVEKVRRTAATMIGADSREIALVPNTTAGINLVAEGYPWQVGDNVVTLANEFPSNQYPWMNLTSRGVECRRVELQGGEVDLQQIIAACDERTRVIAVSWVGYATGYRLDVGRVTEAAHARGIFVFLDAIQGLGVFPLDVAETQVDFLAADGHKWMLGPEGAGIFYVRHEHLDRLRPLGVGWNSVTGKHDFSRVALDVRDEAARYEGGSQNMVGIHGLGASLDLLASLGITPHCSPIADRILDLNEHAAERLRSCGADIQSPLGVVHGSGILSFDLPNRDLADVRRRCLQAGVVLSLRNDWLRISPHAYNDEEDIDRLIDVLS